MQKLLSLLACSFLFASCISHQARIEIIEKSYPTTFNSNKLPNKLHVVGTIVEIGPGYCGTFCIGGYIKINLDKSKDESNLKTVYIITGCLSSTVKTGTKVDVIATLHTGQEQECYYKSFTKPKDIKDLTLYKLTESETQKIR